MATTMWTVDSGTDAPPFTLPATADVDDYLSLSQGTRSPAASLSTSTVNGPTSGVVFADSGTRHSWWFPPAAVTISGTITFNMWAAESSMNNNAGAQCTIERYDSSLAFVSTVVNSEKGTEFPVTTAAAQNWTASPTSTSFVDGDWIKVSWWGNDAGGTMVAAGGGMTLRFGGQAAATGDTWIQFTETITQFSGTPVSLPNVIFERHNVRRRSLHGM